MATGTLPEKWGRMANERTPQFSNAEVTVETDLFDPELRESLEAFFSKGLRRDFRKRFDNAGRNARRVAEGVRACGPNRRLRATTSGEDYPEYDLAAVELGHTSGGARCLRLARRTHSKRGGTPLTVKDLLGLPVVRTYRTLRARRKTRPSRACSS